MFRILMVSKPVAPPWNDSSKNLVRDVTAHLKRYRATVMTARGAQSGIAGVESTGVYARRAGRFAPALVDNARVMLRLLAGDRHDLWHFFFAPNPRSSAAGRVAARARSVPTVQTVCSAPAEGIDLERALFCDRAVVLSRYTERRMLAAGVPRAMLRRIPPAVTPLTPLGESDVARVRGELGLPRDRALLVYPGDLEYSGAAERVLRAFAEQRGKNDAALVLACRKKTAAAHNCEARLRELGRSLGIADRMIWSGETPRIHDLLACADLIALPAENLYAKMDLPLVLIEAMLLARPVILAQDTPAAELAEGDAAVAVAAEVGATAAAIGRLLGDGAERAALGQRARAAALARYQPDNVASAYEALYDELLR
jgi:glycosyltransferase involved in cell wall biosynthesis